MYLSVVLMILQILTHFCSFDLAEPGYATTDVQSSHFIRSKDFIIVQPKISKELIFDDEVLFVQVDKWLLVFQNDGNLRFASNFKAEWVSSNSIRTTDLEECDFKTGFVQGLEKGSRAAVSICGRFVTGFFEKQDGSYFLEPINKTTGEHKLVVTKKKTSFPTRSARSAQLNPDWLFNLTGDMIDIHGNESDVDIEFDQHPEQDYDLKSTSKAPGRNTEIPLEYMRNESSGGSYDEENGYFYDTAWSAIITEAHSWSGNILPTRWLEIAVGVDNTLIAFHGKEKVQQYVLALMNIVNAIYQDASLGANIKLVIARLLLYEHGKHGIIRPGNPKKSLENVNIWNRKLHASLKPDQPKHDVAIWLTRSDLGGPSGYAPVGGVCDPKRSCALNRDEGLTSAFIIAHEMAHMLGLSHDGDAKANNNCTENALEGSVMAAMVSSTFSKFSWSSCSKKEYKEKLSNWTCLSNTPRYKEEILLNATLQTAFSMDEQCRVEFGDGYLMCRAFDIVEPCSHLWCGHVDSPLVCKTKKGPPLEGTECAFGKWCVNGYCSDIPQRSDQVPIVLNPQHGGWSDWSLWGPCSRTCGIGVQYRYRSCDNPKPSYGGKNCEGPLQEFQLCNKSACQNPFVDLKAQQCRILPKILNMKGIKSSDTWLPYETQTETKKCKFSCVSEERKEVFIMDEDLPDGTPCSYESEDQICIQGLCYSIGCDGKLNSSLSRDKCGVCGGDGSGCIKKHVTLKKKLKREVKKISVLPRMARNINIQTNVSFLNSRSFPTIAFILKNRNKKGYAVTIPNSAVHSKIVEGTNFFYRKVGNYHNIWGTGPLLSELLIIIITSSKQALQGIFLSSDTEYSIHEKFLKPSKRYLWVMGGWGPCSATCGGGRRTKTIGCWDNEDSKLVRRKFCSLWQKPSVQTEVCNKFKCEFQWLPGDWEPCSSTCGSYGVQNREIYCIPNSVINFPEFQYNVSLNAWKYMVNPKKCKNNEPVTVRSCNKVPCLYNWEFSEWSECSASCGTGISFRTAHCPALEDGTCGEPPSPQRKICSGNFTRVNNKLCKGRKLRECKEDESKYCAFQLLQRYCQLKGFRRLCCKSCAEYIPRQKNVVSDNVQVVSY